MKKLLLFDSQVIAANSGYLMGVRKEKIRRAEPG